MKSPGFAVIAIMTLAIGIGATTAIFSVANAVLFRKLPYVDPSRLVVALYGGENPASPADYFDWKQQNTVFEHVSAAEYWTPNLTGGDQPEQLRGVRVADNLFEMLGVQPALGRTFTAKEEQPDGAAFVVLSDRLWRRRFGSNPAVVGQTLTFDGRIYQVIGVMPPDFEFPLFWATRAEVWAPLPFGNRRDSAARSLRVFARLKDDVGMQEARSEMDLITKRIAEKRPSIRTEPPLQVLPLHEKIVGDVKPSLIILLSTVGFVLLIACANVANLLLARGNARAREMAVRSAMGATRGRLVLQLFKENALLAAVGATFGLILAFVGLRMLVSGLPIDLLPRQGTISIDAPVLAFVLTLSVIATLLFGAVPAFQASRTDINDALKDGGRSTGGHQTHWRRRILVAAEVAMALVLLIGAGLMLRSFVNLQSVDPGFTTNQLLTMTVSVAGTSQSPGPKRVTFYPAIVDRIRSLPGVTGASLINHLPLAGDLWTVPFGIEGMTVTKPEDQPAAAYRVVYPGYFQTMAIALQGRDFTDRDTTASPSVAIVNEAMARRYFPAEDAIGKRIRPGPQSPWISIVGVVPTVKQQGWTDQAGSELYIPLLQAEGFLSNPAPHFSYMTLVVRTDAGGTNLAGVIRDRIWELESNAPISDVSTMEDVVGNQLARPRMATLLLGGFGLIGLILSTIGVYGVMSYAVSLRSHEIGLRSALGAQPGDVLRLILLEGAGLIGGGIGPGLIAAWAISRLMRTLLYEVTPTDALTFSSVTLVIAIVALVACYIPARRALRVDPIVSLRG